MGGRFCRPFFVLVAASQLQRAKQKAQREKFDFDFL
jgi:hypothetical protein